MTDNESASFVVGVIVGFLIMLAVTLQHFHSNSTIVELGHGEYNSTTGEFQFLPVTNKKTK